MKTGQATMQVDEPEDEIGAFSFPWWIGLGMLTVVGVFVGAILWAKTR
jgi:hypothetical protein